MIERSPDSGRPGWLTCLYIAVPTAAYLLAAAWLVYISRDQINPDGVGYIQAARNYAAGRLDLAVTSWWSPLLSWLLIVPARLGWELTLVVKIIGVLAGLAMSVGGACLVRASTGGRGAIMTYVIGLAMVLSALPEPVTPDLMTAAILTWYFVASGRLLRDGAPRRAFGVGLLGGLAYLSKAYCLPFVLVHLIMTFLIRRNICNQSPASERRAMPALLLACVGALLVAVPWIMVISQHDGKVQISSVTSPTIHAFSPVPIPGDQPVPYTRLQLPRDGRISTWENPAEIQLPWPDWKLTSPEGLRTIAFATAINAQRTIDYMRAADYLGLALLGLLAAGLSLLAGSLPAEVRAQRLWACLSVLLYLGGYMLIVVYDRYVWAVWPMMLAVAMELILGLQIACWLRPAGQDKPIRRFQWALAVLLLVSTIGAAASTGACWAGPTGLGGKYTHIRKVSTGTLSQRVASNEWRQGLFAAFWANATYLGQFDGKVPLEIAKELTPFGRDVTLVIFDDDGLCENLTASGMFREMAPTQDLPNTTGQSIRCFKLLQ